MSFLEKSRRLLTVYKNMPQQSPANSINILLTPQFYTMQKVMLPLKYAFQAKKIAASIFDSFIDKRENIEYLVYKEGESWVFIAYNPKEIQVFLQSKGIKSEQVNKVFFAQQAISLFTLPLLIGRKDALVAINGSVTVVPQIALNKEDKTLTLNDNIVLKNGITLQGSFDSIISRNTAIILSALFIVLSLVFIVDGQRHTEGSNDLKQELEKMMEEFPSLQSEYTRKNIVNKYKNIEKKEIAKRDAIKTLSGFIFKGVKVDNFNMNDKGYSVRFKCLNTKVANRLVELVKKSGFSSVKTLTWNIVYIEGKL